MSQLEKQIHKKDYKNARLILFSQNKSYDSVGVDLLKELREKYKPKNGRKAVHTVTVCAKG